MPPKPKFTRDEMVQAALELVARRGTEALTARELGAALGSSARPIFTVFRSMDELQQAVREAAMRRFEQFVRQPVPDMPVFKQVGMQMVRFAMEEPKLYQLLFMQENAGAAGFSGMVRILGSTADTCMKAIRQDYGLEPDEARYVQETLKLTRTEIRAITRFERGEALISSNNNKVPVVVKASKLEKEMITTDRAELEAILKERQREKTHSA